MLLSTTPWMRNHCPKSTGRFSPMISGNVDIVPRPWCFCPLGLYKHRAALREPFSCVLLRINHHNQRNVIKYKRTQGNTKAHGKSVLWTVYIDVDVAIIRHWEMPSHQKVAYLVSYSSHSFINHMLILAFTACPPLSFCLILAAFLPLP